MERLKFKEIKEGITASGDRPSRAGDLWGLINANLNTARLTRYAVGGPEDDLTVMTLDLLIADIEAALDERFEKLGPKDAVSVLFRTTDAAVLEELLGLFRDSLRPAVAGLEKV